MLIPSHQPESNNALPTTNSDRDSDCTVYETTTTMSGILSTLRRALVDLLTPEEAPTMTNTKEKKNKSKGTAPKATIKAIDSGVLTTLGKLLNYAKDWIPGFQLAKTVVKNLPGYTSAQRMVQDLSRGNIPFVALNISLSTARKRTPKPKSKKTLYKKAPHKKSKQTNSTLVAPSQNQPTAQQTTCMCCRHDFDSRNQLFKHLNAS